MSARGGLAAAAAMAVALLLHGGHAGQPSGPLEDPGAPVMAVFHRFALNALLLPLLDPDAGPLVWTDPSFTLDCGLGTDVNIDGERPPVGRAVSERPYRVHWHLVQCVPFGGDLPTLDGDVELHVTPGPDAVRATVVPRGLKVFDGHDHRPVAEPFEAELVVDRTRPGR
jgi:hypothetical protein